MKLDEEALQTAIRKVRKLRLVDHVPIKDSPPPAITFKAVMESGLGACTRMRRSNTSCAVS